MASADFSQFVVTAADGTACETSRDKSSVFPRLPARFTRLGYGCLLDFAVLRQLIRQTRLISGFCSSGYDFAIPSSRLHLTVQTLGVALGFVGNYAPYGLSPQTDGMPVIHIKAGRLLKNLPASYCCVKIRDGFPGMCIPSFPCRHPDILQHRISSQIATIYVFFSIILYTSLSILSIPLQSELSSFI